MRADALRARGEPVQADGFPCRKTVFRQTREVKEFFSSLKSFETEWQFNDFILKLIVFCPSDIEFVASWFFIIPFPECMDGVFIKPPVCRASWKSLANITKNWKSVINSEAASKNLKIEIYAVHIVYLCLLIRGTLKMLVSILSRCALQHRV